MLLYIMDWGRFGKDFVRNLSRRCPASFALTATVFIKRTVLSKIIGTGFDYTILWVMRKGVQAFSKAGF
jgi:hypothetical protein